MLDSIEQSIQQAVDSFNIENFLQIMLVISAVLFFAGILLRIICGQRSSLSKSVVATMIILMIYVVAVAINIENHYEIFLAPLPFISFSGDYLSIYNISGGSIAMLCAELVEMILLAFVVNLIEDLLPKGNRFLSKYFWRCVTVVLCMVAYWLVTSLLASFMPDFIVTYAPVILMVIVLVLMLGTLFNWLVVIGLLATAGPVGGICGLIYKFFFDTLIGKKLFKAIITTLIIAALVYICNVAGFTQILLTSAEIAAYLPTLAMLAIVWILFILFI